MDVSGPVLLCYDGSAASATAIAAAGRLLAGREALVCHAWAGLGRSLLRGDPAGVPTALRGAAQELEAADREAGERVATEGVELAVTAGFRARPLPIREERKTWRALLAEAERQSASVLVAGAHGLSGVGRALLGSVSTALVHHSSRPVLIVPGAAPGEPRPGPLLLCYDGSASAKHAFEVAAELCAPRDGLVFHFWESWVARAPTLARLSGSTQGMAAELDEIANDQSTEVTARGVELARAAGFEAEGLSEPALGSPWMAILDAAAARDCAGIVVGSRGLTGLSAALGSVSSGVLHHSRRPVLVIPPADTGS